MLGIGNVTPADLNLPAISGEITADYLSAAFDRAGRRMVVDNIKTSRIEGGLTSAKITLIKVSNSQQFVLKKIRYSPESWWALKVGSSFFEAQLWCSGILHDLPKPLYCPTVDMSFHAERSEVWVLMEDISEHIITRESYQAKKFSWIFKGLAQLHAKYCNVEVARQLPLCSLDVHVEVFVKPLLVYGGREKPQEWVTRLLQRPMYKDSLPKLRIYFGEHNWNSYLDLLEYREKWLDILNEYPKTLLHGDLYWKHIAPISSSRVAIIDWNLPVLGPPTADLAWCWFMNFWCFPPKDNLPPMEREPLRKVYLDELRVALGGNVGRHDFERSWHLSWLKVFCQLAWCLAIPTEKEDGGTHAKKSALCAAAMEHAKWIAETYLN